MTGRRTGTTCSPRTRGLTEKYTGTTWKVTFDMPNVASGTATLRLAICGARGNSVEAYVNGRSVGTADLPNSGVMHRDGIRATEVERDFTFDTTLLSKGENQIELKTNARDWTDGVLYDYLRLEIADRDVASRAR